MPVNPTVDAVLGEKAVASLKDIKEHVDIVNVFRRSGLLMDVAKEFVDDWHRCFWAQLGVQDEDTYQLLKEKDYTVILAATQECRTCNDKIV